VEKAIHLFFGDLQMLLKYKYAMLFIVIESCKMQKKEKKKFNKPQQKNDK